MVRLMFLLLKNEFPELLPELMLLAAAGVKLFNLSSCGPSVVVRIFSSNADPLKFEINKLGLGAEAVT